jgi:hypothetical protein
MYFSLNGVLCYLEWSHNFTAFVAEWKRKSDDREYIGHEYLGDNPFGRFVVVEKAESSLSHSTWFRNTGADQIRMAHGG